MEKTKTKAEVVPTTKPEKRRGAPPKPAEDRKDSVIRVLVTTDQRKSLQAAADRTGASLSTWIRLVALRAAAE